MLSSRRRKQKKKSRASGGHMMDAEALERENAALFEELHELVGPCAAEEVAIPEPMNPEAPPERRRVRTYPTRRAVVEPVVQGAARGPSQGELETERLNAKLSEMGLEICHIKPDGNCLYSSVAQQLKCSRKGVDFTPNLLRCMAAAELRAKADEYAIYVSDALEEDTDGGSERLGFEAYCDRVKSDQSMWGGQLEISALCSALNVSISIVSADAPTVEMGVEYRREASAPLVLAFHRHLFATGNHYNGVRKLPEGGRASWELIGANVEPTTTLLNNHAKK